MSAAAVPAPPPPGPPSASTPKLATRFFVGLSVVFGSISTAGLSYLGQRFYLDYQTQQSDQLAKVTTFEKLSGDLPGLVDGLNRQLIAGKDSSVQRLAVAANTREQLRTLTDALPYVPTERVVQIDNYLTILANMTQEVQRVRSPLNAGSFLQEFEYASEQRDEIVDVLRGAAGLKVDKRKLEGTKS